MVLRNPYFGLLVILLAMQDCKGSPEVKRARKTLLTGYNQLSLPSSPTKVEFGMDLLRLNINEEKQTMDADILQRLNWVDSRLLLNSSQFPGVQKIAFRPTEVWLPDIVPYNSMDFDRGKVLSESSVMSLVDQGMEWVAPYHIETACALDFTYWPYDVQKCKFKGGSWTSSCWVIDLHIRNQPDWSKVQGLTGEWNVTKSTTKRNVVFYACCPEPYCDITMELTLERKMTTYPWVVGVPCVVLQVVAVLVFLMPPQSSYKIHISLVAFVAQLVFLKDLCNMVGNITTHPPIIVQLVCIQLIIIGLQMIASCMILRLTAESQSYRLPVRVVHIVRKVAPFLLLESDEPIDQDKNSEELDPNEIQSKGQIECLLLGAFFDRILLIVFCLVPPMIYILYFVLY